MDILFLNPFFHPYFGGTEKHLLEVGKRLSKKHNITVLTSRLDNTPEYETVEGMEVIREPAKILYSLPRQIPAPVPLFRRHSEYLERCLKNCEIVHSHNRFAYMPGDAAVAKKRSKKVALTLHNARPKHIDLLTDVFGAVFDDLVAKRFMKSCDGILAVSEDTLSSTIPNGFSGKTKVIYNGVDETLFRPIENMEWKERLGIEGRMVLTNARLVQQKGLPYLIHAMRGVDAHLVIFGRGPLRSGLERFAERLGTKVTFLTESISEEELVRLYASSDVFVLPSLYEPCGIALLEAMSCGKPVVTTTAGGNEELIRHSKGGIVVPSRDHEALTAAINRIMEDGDVSSSFSQLNRKCIVENYTWDKVAKNVESFYEIM